MPGWPLLAAWTASIARVRMVLMVRRATSLVDEAGAVEVVSVVVDMAARGLGIRGWGLERKPKRLGCSSHSLQL